MKRTLTVCLFVLALTAALSLATAKDAPTRLEVYSFGGADAEAMKETVEAMLGDDANVIVDRTGRIMVVGTDEQHALVAQLVEKVSIPPVNVRIDVRFLGASSSSRNAVGVSGSGGVIVNNGKINSRFVLKPTLESRSTTTSDNVGQQLLVMSGRTGSLRVGERVPYIDWLVDYGYRGGYLSRRVAWEDVGSFLTVAPTVIGEGPMIRIVLTPELRGLVNGSPYHVAYSKVATELVASDGETIKIGGSTANREFYSRFLAGFDRNSQQKALDIQLTPHIVR